MLEHLTKYPKSVDKYYRELELAINRANLDENEETMMDRFLHEMNHEIMYIVAMHYCNDLNDMVHYAMMVE